MNAESISYFAYGSNLHIARIVDRVSSAAPVGMGYVICRRLAFHKRSVDGSSKADAVLTKNSDDRVWGAVYRIAAQQKPMLDRCEFLGVGYDQQRVDVITARGTSVKAWMYVARHAAIDATLRPYCWYLEYLIRGGLQHRLPLCYISKLHQVETQVDSDADRIATNRRRVSAAAHGA